jgi:hypothetical protein
MHKEQTFKAAGLERCACPPNRCYGTGRRPENCAAVGGVRPLVERLRNIDSPRRTQALGDIGNEAAAELERLARFGNDAHTAAAEWMQRVWLLRTLLREVSASRWECATEDGACPDCGCYDGTPHDAECLLGKIDDAAA